MAKATYWSSIEYTYNTKHVEYGNVKGGFVYVFFFADDVLSFIAAVEKDMGVQKMDIIRIEFVSLYDFNMQWESANDTDRYIQIAKRAERSKEVVFDDFYAYENK